MSIVKSILIELGYSNINFESKHKPKGFERVDIEANKNKMQYYFIELINPANNEPHELRAQNSIKETVKKLKNNKNNFYMLGLIIPFHPIFYTYIIENEVYNDFEIVMYSPNGKVMNSEMLKKLAN